MPDPDASRQVEIKDGEEIVATAHVSKRDEATARASLLPPSGHVPPDSRASLVDAVVETPEVQQSRRLEATVPLGDSVALDRIRERTEEASTRPAGATALVNATLPGGEPASPPEASPPSPPPASGAPGPEPTS